LDELKVFEQLEYVRRTVEILFTQLSGLAKKNSASSPKCPKVYEEMIEKSEAQI